MDAILGMANNDGATTNVRTKIQGVIAAMQNYRGAIDGQLAELQAFRESVGKQTKGLKKENEDLKAEVNTLRLVVANLARGRRRTCQDQNSLTKVI